MSSENNKIRFLPLDAKDPTARLFAPFSVSIVWLVSALALLMLLAPLVAWYFWGSFIRQEIVSSRAISEWLVPASYTFLSVFLAFFLTQAYQRYQDYKTTRLKLAGLLRALASEAASAVQELSVRRAEYPQVPDDPQQRLDFVRVYSKSLELIQSPIMVNEMAELLDRHTFQVFMERFARMASAKTHAVNTLTSMELNLSNELSGSPDQAIRSQSGDAWHSLLPVLDADIAINGIWLYQINDRLTALNQEKVSLHMPLDSGFPLDAGIIGKGCRDMEDDIKTRLDKSLEIAIDNRKLEIELLWRRTLVFWGFIAALFVAVGTLKAYDPQLTIVLSSMGIVFSFIWSLVNRASKSWQESWEIKAKQIFDERYQSQSGLYKRLEGNQDGVFPWLRPSKFSVSRLLIILSDYLALFWTGLTVYLVARDQLETWLPKGALGISFTVFSVLYIVYAWLACRSRPD